MYAVYRYYLEGEPELIEEGLTLKEARDHCKDPNSSSRQCASSLDYIAEARGPWFDGFEEQ